MDKKPSRLKDIIVDEVSFVKKGANKKKFLLRKADEPLETKIINDNNDNKLEEISMKEAILKAAEAVELDNETVTEAITKAKISQEGAEAITTVLKVLKAAEKDLPVEFYPNLITLAGGKLPVTEKIVEVEKKSVIEKNEELKKAALAALSADQREVMEQALAISKAAQEKTVEIEARLEKEQDLRETAVFVAKAEKEFKAIPEKAEVIGAILKKAAKTFTKEEAASLEKIFKAAVDAIETRKEFTTTGTIGDGQIDSAYGTILAKAAELRLTDPKMSIAKAISQVALDNPKAYSDYLAEVN